MQRGGDAESLVNRENLYALRVLRGFFRVFKDGSGYGFVCQNPLNDNPFWGKWRIGVGEMKTAVSRRRPLVSHNQSRVLGNGFDLQP